MTTDVLIVAALKDELKHHFEDGGIPVLYTGIGKVNAAYYLARELTRLRQVGRLPRAVINFGTAGSPVFKTHELVECASFVQRDMDLTPLGFAHGVTPFEETPAILEVPRRLSALPTGICGTGDSFENGAGTMHSNVFDMEAYALAKVSLLEGVPFMSVKYITDGCDHNAHNDWNENLHKAAASFINIYGEVAKVI
ncbi:adenosylhomocysteine nucleosidase [Paucimonas lemoignei]|uniref:Adenosylhomocysteine nucleosidase n=1 Tax=Paucimonas lemoignei TaxID=29443 RepID=A0A4R3HXU1_PAULE|nr:5'-nucleosidase [Paucimonas lemoignei]TCS36269.1 adenosylhomocysteine nucleosidase [Paucimonas lemoignei]